ncbi:UDP-N-acetylglucosamine--undecaprenyl-phosphate N-acetylglucosaminephosphotransferase [Thalassomonas sp. M1454]|uniref:UDP-N-acetylglucosamine--undecaprenyl-phosphate N-acetylglucosaminephosphotransferase n=1 Tax=Thalassomonas sp. M1454 TaxID=2594477 RepID=UPI00117E5646|nr:UDP-N-acetylglucosamine--undecaprenyl-phosphate N-acetylglucosaminephosphotransferase [Thalassomonas sp. M1454]TRX57416.1 UDP-N-acetylglucosamine--undecaprenyl-phosphate N-acetylglucosaminephosphotransferase [Thalassomonas sp. M1454]
MPTLYLMLFPALTAFLFALVAIKIIKPIALEVGLVDAPSERKKHSGNIPLIGGISIFLAVLAATVIWMPNTQELRLYLIASAMMVFIGAVDDKYDLSVGVRLVGQLIIASLMIYGVGAYIQDLGNIFNLGNVDLGWFGIPFTYFAIIVAINAFNMIDGIDGLLGSLSINTFTALAVLFIYQGQEGFINYALILATAIFPYLLFNLGVPFKNTKKIFMGDAGAMFIGLSVVWLLSEGSQGETRSFSAVTALWITAVPLMDMLAIVIRRLRKGHSPFKPDRDHIHHILLRLGYNPRQALIIISILAALLSSIGILGEVYNIADSFMFALFLAVFGIYHYVLRNTERHNFILKLFPKNKVL